MTSENTTLKLGKGTKKRLDNLKEYRRETYDEILQKLLDILTVCRMSPERARSRLVAIEKKKRRTQNPLKLSRLKMQRAQIKPQRTISSDYKSPFPQQNHQS